MVVDDDLLADKKARRFLAYDLMALNGRSVVHQPWKVDWGKLLLLLEGGGFQFLSRVC